MHQIIFHQTDIIVQGWGAHDQYWSALRKMELVHGLGIRSYPIQGINRDHKLVHLHKDYERAYADKWYKIVANSEFIIHSSEF